MELLTKKPHSFAELRDAIGEGSEKAIRSHLEKRRTSGVYAHDGERYSLKAAKPKKAAPKKQKAPGSASQGPKQPQQAELPV